MLAWTCSSAGPASAVGPAGGSATCRTHVRKAKVSTRVSKGPRSTLSWPLPFLSHPQQAASPGQRRSPQHCRAPSPHWF